MLDVSIRLSRKSFVLRAELKDSGFICLTGPNGSGKSTLLGVVAGTLKPDDGHVRVNGTDVTDFPMEKRRIVLVTPESYIPHLEVDKHLAWGAKAKGSNLGSGEVARVREALGVSYSGRVDQLSLGMRERVSLATALLAKPDVILVDEAFANIDDRQGFIQPFREICAENGTDVLHTTQLKADAQQSDHHYELNAGTSSRVF